MQVAGKTVKVVPAKAKDFFDIQEKHEKQRDFNQALMALCVLDENDKPAFTPEETENMTLPEWRKLEAEVSKANSYQGDEKN